MSHWPAALTDCVVEEALHGVPATPRLSEGAPAPWEDWYDRALAEGIEQELAWLGRSVMRDAWVQSWDDDLRIECGWLDGGEAMLELARADPERACAAWTRLLDGEEVCR